MPRVGGGAITRIRLGAVTGLGRGLGAVVGLELRAEARPGRRAVVESGLGAGGGPIGPRRRTITGLRRRTGGSRAVIRIGSRAIT